MFEEPEWAEAAPVAAGLGPIISRPPPAAASQNKASSILFRPTVIPCFPPGLQAPPALGHITGPRGSISFTASPQPMYK
ncbi:RRP8 isoform 3 [Pongo abelii]|uniref:RRP8 isoform 3 n=1 Tax=Pongo abelii TaxID=9601 RepID=A0A2J8SVM4_PONAB|nr:RRP8 isoform 3 [Pongo abelii]